MQSTGVVNKINGSEAVVLIKRESACGDNCANCGGCTGGTLNEVLADNEVGANIGDIVIVEMKTGRVLNAAVFAYVVPLLLLFVGYFLFFYMFKTEFLAVLGGFLFMISSYVILHFFDKKLKNAFVHKIVEIKKSI